MILGCSSTQWVSVSSQAGRPMTEIVSPEHRLSVLVDSAEVRLPLHVSGSELAFIDLDRALVLSIERAFETVNLGSSAHTRASFVVLVELLNARAAKSSERLVVELVARVTLRRNPGNLYVAQTHAHARCAGTIDATKGASTVRSCIDSVASQLQGWMNNALQN